MAGGRAWQEGVFMGVSAVVESEWEKAQGAAQCGHGHEFVGLGFSPAHAGGGQGGLCVNHLGGESQPLFKARMSQLGALRSLLHGFVRYLEPFHGFAEVGARLANLQVDAQPELPFLFLGCVQRGLYLHDYAHRAPMHHGFSAQHTAQDIDEALNIIEDALRGL